MIDQNLLRAEALAEQGNFQKALDYAQQALGREPDNVDALRLMAQCLLNLQRYTEAERVLQDLVAREPDNGWVQYLLGFSAYAREDEDLKKAKQHLHLARELEPFNAAYPALLGNIFFSEKKWQLALDAANKALELDPNHLEALNLRSRAQLKLGDKQGAANTMDKVLNEDAENSYSHSTTGWNLLEMGDHRKAMGHFKTALQLNPSNRHAKQGMGEALKAKNIVYRAFLKYSFWMSKLQGRTQWILIIGAYLLIRVLSRVSASNPGLSKFIVPIIVAYTIFALSTWIIPPLSNLFLRLDKQGKFALSEHEMRVSHFTLGSVVAIGLGLLLWAASFLDFNLGKVQTEPLGLGIAGMGFLMLLPASGLLAANRHNWKTMLIVYIVLGVLGLLGLNAIRMSNELMSPGILFFVGGIFIYQFLGQALLARKKPLF